MKTYYGIPERTEQGGFLVEVIDSVMNAIKIQRTLSPAPSQKLYNHSPNGFNWGYGGSGPAQLSLALLLDVTKDEERSLRHYQKFKFQVVASWPTGKPWTYTEEELLHWLESS